MREVVLYPRPLDIPSLTLPDLQIDGLDLGWPRTTQEAF